MKDTSSTRDDQPVSGSCPALEKPMSTYVRLLNEQVSVADNLEGIANGLPHEIDPKACQLLSSRVSELMDVWSNISCHIIIPALVARPSPPYLSRTTAARLIDERMTDQDYATEISELLSDLAKAPQRRRHELTGAERESTNTAGYMLRGFFETTRRSAAFELEYIIPAASGSLREPELAEMGRLLSDHGSILPRACLTTRQAVGFRTH